MDRGKKTGKFLAARNSNVHIDLKDVIRDHALPFLPAKSLFRFRSVCRDWKHQISTPFFSHNQSLYCRAVSGLFCQSYRNPPLFIPMNPNSSGVPDPSMSFLPEPVDIRSSSHGLLCCQGYNGDRAYYVCNPATKQWNKLPKPNACHGSDPAVVLIFEPSQLNFMADYNLICAFPSADFDEATEFEIYSSRDNSWNVSGEICFGARKVKPRSGVHVNGVVFWKMVSGGILSFDLTKDRSLLLKSYFDGVLGTIDGKLCKVSVSGYTISVSVLVNVHANTMQMSSRSKMWDDKRRINLNTDVLALDAVVDCKAVFLDNDILVIRNGKKFYSYDFKSDAIKALTWAAEWAHDMRCVPYVNSLISL